MTIHKQELVLCASLGELPARWLDHSVAIPLEENVFFTSLENCQPHWMARENAEKDENFKQIIPYTLVQNATEHLVAYPRQGSETRLHGSWSVGLGGHINPDDLSADHFSWRSIVYGGLMRELSEEFPAAVDGDTRFLGLINENLSPVGRVHLGIVFLHQANEPCDKAGEELRGMQWLKPSELGSSAWPLDNFELWSRLALQLITPKT